MFVSLNNIPTGATSRAGTAYHSRALFCVVFCGSLHACPLFVFLVWSLYFLSFNLRFLITPFFTFKLFLHNNVHKHFLKLWKVAVGLWCLMLHSTVFQLYISWRSVQLLGKTTVPASSHWRTLSHKVVSSTLRYERDSNLQL
jgi:hypothetical protein